MSRPTRSNVRSRSSRLALRAVLIGVVVLALGACSGGGCGDCESFEQAEFPEQHYDKTVPRSGQVRITNHGLDFLEGEVPNLIRQFRPQGLDFCVPRTEQSGATICHIDQCDNGTTGCQIRLSLDDANLEPVPSETLNVQVTIGDINEVLPFDYDVLVGTAECKADLHKRGESNDTPAVVEAELPVLFQVDQQAALKNVTIETDEMQVDLSDVGIDIDGRGGFGDTVACEGADTFVKPFARGTVEDEVKAQLNETIQQIVREQTCQTCGADQPACPSGSSCENSGDLQLCTWDSDGTCVSEPLGTEGRLLLGSALGEFMEPADANIDVLARAADLADVDSGLSFGMRAGFQQDELRECAPAESATRPSLSPIQESMKILRNDHPESGDPFMVGIGIHENAFEQALWSAWASGGTCLRVGSSFNDSLNTGALGLFMPSLKNLAENESPVYLRVSPQTAPEVELGPNEIVEEEDSYTLEEPLMTILWNDLDLHFYAFAQDRFVRVYTTRLDVEVPIGLTTNGDGQLVPVVGNLEDAAKDVRIRNHRLLAEGKEKLADVVPTLLSAALPRLTGSLSDPIDLPAFYGYRLVVDEGGITSVDNDQFLALFANFERDMQTNSHLAELEPRIDGAEVEAAFEAKSEVPKPRVRLQLTAGTELGVSVPHEDVEFSYRVDDGFWSLFRGSREFAIEHPLLRLQGEHEVEVRARYADMPGTASEPVSTDVRVDLEAPSLSLVRDEMTVRLEGRDAVDSAEDLRFRHRIATKEGELLADWTSWSERDKIDLEELNTEKPVRIRAEVRDRAGYVAEASDVFETDPRLVSGSGPAGSNGTEVTESSTSCALTGRNSGGDTVPTGLLWLFGLGALGMRLRRRRGALSGLGLIGALAGFVLILGACNNDIAGEDSATCDPECAEWESCESGTCTPNSCAEDADCAGAAICIDGVCAAPECSSAADCSSCPGEETAVCADARCSCENFCPDGCDDGEYCCHADNSCTPFPDPCAGKSCEPGLEPEATSMGTPNPEECEVEGASCECVEKEPLELKWYGQYTSIDSNADLGDCTDCVVAVSTYNKHYGDLMVGVVGEDLTPTWFFPDGVPSDGEVVAAPSGPRGGIEETGDDVGTYSAIAVDTEGNLHVFYRSKEDENLRYARGVSSSGSYEFETTTIDEQTGSGLYASAAIGPDGNLHVVYGVNEVDVEIEGETITGSELRHASFPPETELENLSPDSETLEVAGTRNPCVRCGDGEVCFTDDPTCRAPTSDCEESCEDGLKCYEGTCEPIFQETQRPAHRLMTGLYSEIVRRSNDLVIVYYNHVERRIAWIEGQTGDWSDPNPLEESTGPYGSGAVDANGELHFAYMKADDRSLVYRAPGNEPVSVRDGIRSTASEYTASPIGEDVDLRFDSTGSARLLFHDATRHRLLQSTRSGSGGWTTKTVSEPTSSGTYDGARGFFAGAAPSGSDDDGEIAVEHVIDQQSDPAEARLEFLRLK